MDQSTVSSMATKQSPRLVVDWNELNRPGAYVTSEGSLVRVPKDALKEQHSPNITVESTKDTTLTLIDDNPYVPIGKARRLAANFDLAVSF